MDLKDKQERMLHDINKLFQRIEDNKETLIMKYVKEDLNKLHLEIQRTITKMGL